MDLNGKLALVTGGTAGIGLEIARQLKSHGAQIIICGRRPELIESAQAEGMEAIAIDLSNADGCNMLAKAMAGKAIDILVNNAGMGGNFGKDDPLDLALTDRAIFLNLNAPIHLIGQLLPQLLKRPHAMIVNITSGLAVAPRAGGPVYCATKAGLRSFTQCLRHNLKDTNVHVLEALPPVVDTEMTRGRMDGRKMSAAECAAQIVDAMVSGKTEINVGMVKILQMIYSLSPKLARNIMIRF